MNDLRDHEMQTSAQRHTELLLYDYFKHLTTLALVALGGVLTISDGADQVSDRNLLLVVVLISISGASSLTAIDKMTKARLKEMPLPTSMNRYRWISTATFAMGIGAYIAIFLSIFR